MKENTQEFKFESNQLRKRMCRKHAKWIAILVGIVVRCHRRDMPLRFTVGQGRPCGCGIDMLSFFLFQVVIILIIVISVVVKNSESGSRMLLLTEE